MKSNKIKVILSKFNDFFIEIKTIIFLQIKFIYIIFIKITILFK